MQKEIEQQIAELQDLCVRSQVATALSRANTLLKSCPKEASVLLAAIKTYLFAGFTEQAVRLSSVVARLPKSLAVEPAIYNRLKLSGADIHQLTENSDVQAPEWVVQHLETGQDPTYDTVFLDYNIRCFDGSIHYDFKCQCNSCGQKYDLTIASTFLVWRDYFCPSCLAAIVVNYDIIKAFLQGQTASIPQHLTASLDRNLRKLQYELDEDAMKGECYPLISRYLSQDYVFLMNQFIINRLVK